MSASLANHSGMDPPTRQQSDEDIRRRVAAVEQRLGMGSPRVLVHVDPDPNTVGGWADASQSWAIEGIPYRGLITLTRGLVDGLSAPELDAVIAHELTHVRRCHYTGHPPESRDEIRRYAIKAELAADLGVLDAGLKPEDLRDALEHVRQLLAAGASPGRSSPAYPSIPERAERLRSEQRIRALH